MFENEAVSRVLPMNARTVLPTAWSNRRKKWSIKKTAEYSYNHECNHLEIKAIIIDLIPEIAGTMFNTPTSNHNYITRL